jgi:serine/threonine protein kinase
VSAATSEAQVVREPGDRIGRYHVLEKLGQGGLGEVYRAFDPKLERVVAVKLIRIREANEREPARLSELRARLLREARGLAQVSHPSIVAVYDVGLFHGEDPFLAMELLGSKSLRQYFSERVFDRRCVLKIYLEVAAGLAAAHQAGIVHRDVKPESRVLADDGRVRVLDFGLIIEHRNAFLVPEQHEHVVAEVAKEDERPGFWKWWSRFGRRAPAPSTCHALLGHASETFEQSHSSQPAAGAFTSAGSILGTPR